MPATLESAVLLLVLIGPGFIASQVKNGLIPHHERSDFRETIDAIVLSALMLPIWLVGYAVLGPVDGLVSMVWGAANADIVRLITLIFPVYLLVAPLVGCVLAVATLRDFPSKAFDRVVAALGANRQIKLVRGPEPWDKLFQNATRQYWARVTYQDGSSLEGKVLLASAAPSNRQLVLIPVDGQPQSLVRLDASCTVSEDLSEKSVAFVWIEVGNEISSVELY